MSSTGILQVVNGDGEFNEQGVNEFVERHNIRDVGVGYQVVAITGPQSSGKSTLMNALVSEPFLLCVENEKLIDTIKDRALPSRVNKVDSLSAYLKLPQTQVLCIVLADVIRRLAFCFLLPIPKSSSRLGGMFVRGIVFTGFITASLSHQVTCIRPQHLNLAALMIST